jgi:hypothetical protein
MNTPNSPAVEIALRKQVERAVRPVHATEQRKLRMREELLAHLTAIYVEEQSRLGDETAALAASRERFGDPAELTAELNRSVGAWQRFAWAVECWERRLDKLIAKRKDESPWRYAARSLITITAFTIGMMAVVCGMWWTVDGPLDSGVQLMLPRLFPLMIVVQWANIGAATYVDNLTATGRRRWALLFLQSAVWCLVLTATAASFWWSISDRGLNPSQLVLLGARSWAVVAGLLVLIVFVVDYSRLLRRQREAWTLLKIDE